MLRSDADIYDRTESHGGVLRWPGCHLPDFAQCPLDDPIVRVDAQMSRGTDGANVEDGALLRAETGSGVLGSLYFGCDTREGKKALVDITGTRGSADLLSAMGAGSYADRTVPELEYAEAGTCAPAPASGRDSAPGSLHPTGVDYAPRSPEAPAAGTAEVLAVAADATGVLRVLDATDESADTDSWTAASHPGGRGGRAAPRRRVDPGVTAASRSLPIPDPCVPSSRPHAPCSTRRGRPRRSRRGTRWTRSRPR